MEQTPTHLLIHPLIQPLTHPSITYPQSMMESGAAEEGEFGSFDWTGGAPQTLGATGRTRASSSRMDSRQSVHGAAAGGSTDGGLQATGPGIGATYVDPLIGHITH